MKKIQEEDKYYNLGVTKFKIRTLANNKGVPVYGITIPRKIARQFNIDEKFYVRKIGDNILLINEKKGEINCNFEDVLMLLKENSRLRKMKNEIKC